MTIVHRRLPEIRRMMTDDGIGSTKNDVNNILKLALSLNFHLQVIGIRCLYCVSDIVNSNSIISREK